MADDHSTLNPDRPWPFVVEEFPADELLSGSRVFATPKDPAPSPERKEPN